MKVKFFDNEHGADIELIPETPEEMAALARTVLNKAAKPFDAILYVVGDAPYARFWIEKVKESVQVSYVSKKKNI